MTTAEKQHRKFLVIADKTLTDALTLIPALETLKQKRPGIQIDMIAPGLYPLKNAYQSVVNIIDHNPINRMDRKKRFNWMKEQQYQWAWNTENLNSHWRRIFEVVNHPTWISAPPSKNWPNRSILTLRKKQLSLLFSEIDWITAPLLELSLDQAQQRQSFLAEHPEAKYIIGIQPAQSTASTLPISKYIELIKSLLNRSGFTVLLFTTPDESIPFEKSLSGYKTLEIITEPIQRIIPKLAACDLFIGNNDGYYHLAYALRYPVVGIFNSRKEKAIWSYRSKRSKSFSPGMIQRRISVNSILRSINQLLKPAK